MRELKFRAWANGYEKWCHSIEYMSDGLWLGYVDDGVGELSTTDIIVEQYTGLKDKNGKEIYEGDIVRTESCDQPNFSAGAIEMVQEMYLIMNSAHYRDPELTHCEPLGHYCDTEVEVVGNIHENPGLEDMKRYTIAELCGEEEE